MKDYEQVAKDLSEMLGKSERLLEYYTIANRKYRVFYHDEYMLYALHSRANGLIKVGITGNISKRKLALEAISRDRLFLISTNPVTRDKAYALESFVHSELSEYKYNGEWFHDGNVGDILATIEDACSTFENENMDMFDLYHSVNLSTYGTVQSDVIIDIELISERVKYAKNVYFGLMNTTITDSNGKKSIYEIINQEAQLD